MYYVWFREYYRFKKKLTEEWKKERYLSVTSAPQRAPWIHQCIA